MTIEREAPHVRRDDPRTASTALTVWFPLLLVVVMVLGTLRSAARPISDPDAWWHLRVGHLLWSGDITLTRTGPLSSFATEPWTPRDWIPQLVSSLMERWFGLPGVAWLYGASLVVFVVVAYVVSRRQADPLLAALATALCFVGAAGSLSQRPQMVSFILLLVFVDAWLRTAADLRPRWWLIPLMWLWASSHGMWYLGIAIGLLAVVGLLLDDRLSLRESGRLALVPGLGLLAAAVTPAGPALLVAAVQTGDKWDLVTEWAPPDFTTLSPAVSMLMVALVALTWARLRVPLSWVHLLLLLLATAMVLMAGRTVAAGAAILAPLLAMTLQQAMYRRPPSAIPHVESRVLLTTSVVTVIALALLVPRTSHSPGAVPNGLNDELEDLPDGSALLNAYVLGGWLHWRHPEINTVIDGFTDGYTVEALKAYLRAVGAAPGWEDYVRTSGVEVALLNGDSPLTSALTDHLGWVVVAREGDYVLLREPGD